MAATIKGIDVSMYQTNVDFAKVKAAGYSFVIIRCNNWDHTKNCVVKDPLFETHYKNAKAAGLDVGAYYYTWQTTVSGAKKDFLHCAGGSRLLRRSVYQPQSAPDLHNK